MRFAVGAFLLDVVCVLAFVVIGRLNHADGLTTAGVALTAWPFACGLVAGWLASLPWRPWRDPSVCLSTGWIVCIVTVCGGMQLRDALGEGTQFSFFLVTALFLAATMLGWRGVAKLLGRGRERSAGGEDEEDAAALAHADGAEGR